MFNLRATVILSLLASSLVLSGCSEVKPLSYSDRALLIRGTPNWIYTPTDGQAASKLLDLVSVPDLHELVRQGIDANPGLKQTALVLESSHLLANISRAERLPTLTASLSREKTQGAGELYSGSLSSNWPLDIWGKLADATNAAEADALSAEAAHILAKDLLASGIIEIWLQLIQQERLIGIREARLNVLLQNEDVILERYRKGLDELSDFDTAKSASESERATLAAAHETRESLRRALRILLGGEPFDTAIPGDFPAVIVPLASQPDQDLARRPDLQQAYRDIVAAEYRAKVAYKALLPSLSLNAAITDSGGSLSDALFASPAWSLLGQLTQPLFQGGQLRNEAEIAELAVERQYWAYRETLLNAVNEIDTAISLEKSLQVQQQHVRLALESAERSHSIHQEKYRQGLVTFLDLLQIQKATFDLQIQLTQLTYQRLSNRIVLGLALGLGVDHE